MREVDPKPELATYVKQFQSLGGILDFVFLEYTSDAPREELHRSAALAGMAALDRRFEKSAMEIQEKWGHPTQELFRIRFDENLLKGARVSFETFWGTNLASPKATREFPGTDFAVDGYESAFFRPPHGLSGNEFEKEDSFLSINEVIFGDHPDQAEIFSWSTDWSNYFDAGKEWWGAFFWTIRRAGTNRITVIGASTTD